MKSVSEKVETRKKAAMRAIKSAYGTEQAEYEVTLFVSHHLDEIETDYWQEHLATSEPKPIQVLDMLVLRAHWDDVEGVDSTYDFTLPNEITDYVISVRFDEMGAVEAIAMES